MVNSRQMNQNHRHRHRSLPTVLVCMRVWKAIWRLVLKPNCYSSLSLWNSEDALVSLFFWLQRCPQPSGKWYNEDPYACTLPHFNCKRYTHPALWTSDGCIMGHAQNMTVHHVRTMCCFTSHCCLLLHFISHTTLFYLERMLLGEYTVYVCYIPPYKLFVNHYKAFKNSSYCVRLQLINLTTCDEAVHELWSIVFQFFKAATQVKVCWDHK